MPALDGKMRITDVADTEQLLRLIQSIPSKKAEPFKLWLARTGRERILVGHINFSNVILSSLRRLKIIYRLYQIDNSGSWGYMLHNVIHALICHGAFVKGFTMN